MKIYMNYRQYCQGTNSLAIPHIPAHHGRIYIMDYTSLEQVQ